MSFGNPISHNNSQGTLMKVSRDHKMTVRSTEPQKGHFFSFNFSEEIHRLSISSLQRNSPNLFCWYIVHLAEISWFPLVPPGLFGSLNSGSLSFQPNKTTRDPAWHQQILLGMESQGGDSALGSERLGDWETLLQWKLPLGPEDGEVHRIRSLKKYSIQTPHPTQVTWNESLYSGSLSQCPVPFTVFLGGRGTLPCEDLGLSSSCLLSNPRSSPGRVVDVWKPTRKTKLILLMDQRFPTTTWDV